MFCSVFLDFGASVRITLIIRSISSGAGEVNDKSVLKWVFADGRQGFTSEVTQAHQNQEPGTGWVPKTLEPSVVDALHEWPEPIPATDRRLPPKGRSSYLEAWLFTQGVTMSSTSQPFESRDHHAVLRGVHGRRPAAGPGMAEVLSLPLPARCDLGALVGNRHGVGEKLAFDRLGGCRA